MINKYLNPPVKDSSVQNFIPFLATFNYKREGCPKTPSKIVDGYECVGVSIYGNISTIGGRYYWYGLSSNGEDLKLKCAPFYDYKVAFQTNYFWAFKTVSSSQSRVLKHILRL